MDKKVRIALVCVYVVVFNVVTFYNSYQFAGTANLTIFIALTVISLIFLWKIKDIRMWRFGSMGGLLAVVIILSLPNVSYDEAKASLAAQADLIEPEGRMLAPVEGHAFWEVFQANWYYLFEVRYQNRTEKVLVNPMNGELLVPNEDLREELTGEHTLKVGVIGNISLPEIDGVRYQSANPKELLTSETLYDRLDLWVIDREYNELFSTPEYRKLAADNELHMIYLESSKGHVAFIDENQMMERDTYSDYNDEPQKKMFYIHHRQGEPARLIIRHFDLTSSYSDEDYQEIMKQIQQEPFVRK